ncbi:MAG: hypothetical protein WC378_00125 [Opitutaceae bacterium]
MDASSLYDLEARGAAIDRDTLEAWTDEAREKSAETRARNKQEDEPGTSRSKPVVDLPVYHGGLARPGKLVTYYTTDKDAAASYVDMYNDRFGGGGAVHASKISIKNPAPVDVVKEIALQIGMDADEVEYTPPASLFDAEIFGEDAVRSLLRKLTAKGYDGAVLPDVPYGSQGGDSIDAYVVFTSLSTPPWAR